ncbi:hypothetical protein L1S32_10445 [Methanogenium sp. S4BF]|uniref:hypothetical protein n=1 Tax=Methanogenium sp. S4BF TaxID=1789226 RepID=UPI002417E723|nr:hypothetical protein [Methanogenium sp. S4BF]WFN34250.1 hypothetical protein L1S32_10445 [Methanogenium sp. S4BF]
MKDKNWIIVIACTLIVTSALLYSIHYLVFHDLHHIAVFGLHELAFLPVEVLIVTLVIHRLLDEREKKQKLEKLNMVIGTFFSRVGTTLITCFASHDPNLESVRSELVVTDTWSEENFSTLAARMKTYQYDIDACTLDLERLRGFLLEREDFLMRMLENPVLLEHEEFTELLRATFHLTEELSRRGAIAECPLSDISHLGGDVKRVYGLLIHEWVAYMHYLKKNYPYLFSLALRTNPFDPDSSVMVT